MKKYKIIISPSAKVQIREITAYIRDKLFAPQAAKTLAYEIKHTIASLATMPERIQEVSGESKKIFGLRRMVVKNFLVYFQIDESAKQVNVVAVIYGKRDQIAQLEEILQH